MRLIHVTLPRPVCAVLRAAPFLAWSALLLTGGPSTWAAPLVSASHGVFPAKPRPKPVRILAPGVPPAAPSSLSLSFPAPTSIQLSWTSNSTSESSFSAERKIDGQPDTAYTPIGSADPVDNAGARVSFTDPGGLDFDTVYDYRVRAIAADGTPSDYSNVAIGTTAPAKPITVTVTAVAGSDSKLLLSWVDNARHSSYFYVYRKGPGETAFTSIGYTTGNGYPYFTGTGVPGKGNTLTITDTGLTVSSAYSYYVTANNGGGASDPSDTAVGTTLTTQTAPTAPSVNAGASSGADGTADPKTTIRAYLTDSSTNAATVTLQKINNDDPASVYTNFPGYPKPVTGVGGFYDNYDKGLAVDTSYSYRGYASNSKGPSPVSNIATAITVPVKPITVSVSAVAGSDSKLLLSWVDNARHSSYFYVYRKGPGETAFTSIGYTTGNGYPYFTGTGVPGKGNTLTITDTGLTVSSAYSYYVTANNGGGASDPSDTAVGTTLTTQTAPTAPSVNAGASSGADGTADPKTTIRAYLTDSSTNAATVTLQKINNDDPASVYTNFPGYPKPVTGVGGFYDNYDKGLAVDTSYSYRAFASNAAGPSPFSNVATAITVPVKPITVSVSAVAGSDSKLLLSWVDNARHSSYFYVYRKGPGETAFTSIGYTTGNGYPYFTGTGVPGKGNTLTITDTGLTVSSAYSYYVTANNGGGASDPSDTAVGTTLTTQTAPTAPSVNAGASSGVDGTADPKTTIRAYLTDSSTNAATVTLQKINNDDPASVYTNFPGYPKPVTGVGGFYDNYDKGLAVDTSYSYRGYASNSKGPSPVSNIATAITVPVKPITVKATPISDTKIRLSWVDNARHSSYFYVYRKGPGETAFTSIGYTTGNGYPYFTGTGVPGKGNTLTITDTGLTVSSAYSYYVTANNGAGASDVSDTVTATTFPSNPPGAPTDMQAAGAAKPSQINLNWLDNSTTEFGFIVERQAQTETKFSALPGPNPGDPTVGPSPGTGRVYYNDKAVTDDTTYTYRVKATNPAGESAYSNTIAATTAPTAVSGLGAAAVAGTNDSIKLTWTSSSKHEDGFNVYRKAPGETVFTKRSFAPAAAGPGSVVTFTDPGLTTASSYSYYVTAYNSAGESAASSTITATSGTITPTTVTISSPANGAKFNTGTGIPVTVTAVPAVGATIVSYTLITNDVPVTQATGSFTLTGLAAGTYTLKAKALDSTGNTAAFTGITISVVNQPPTITNAALTPATLPATGGTITVTATITDPNGAGLSNIYASLSLNGTVATNISLSNGGSGSAYSGTYTAPANISGSAAVYTANVSAQNAASLSTTVSAAGSCTQSSGNPVPVITSVSPVSASVGATGLTLTINGSGFVAGATVTFGTSTGLVPVAGSLTAAQLRVAIPDSALTAAGSFSVTVTNPAPGGGASNAVSFPVITPAPTAPVLQSAAPGDGQVSLTFSTVANAATYTLKSAAQAGGAYHADVTGLTASAGAATLTATDPNQANGVKKYYVVSAVGPGGESLNSNELSATPQHANVPPAITLTAPADGATAVAPASVTLSATASDSDGTVAQVEFFQNGISVGIAHAAPYTVTVSGLAVGAYTFKAVATDNSGAATSSGSAVVTVSNPVVGVTFLTGPTDQSTVCATTVIFTWSGYSATTSADQLRYQYQIDGGLWSTPAPAAQAILSGLAEGVHTFAVQVLNTDGSIAGSPLGRSFFVSLTPPALLSSTVDPRDTRVTVNWITSKPTTGQVEFGKTTAYGQLSDPTTTADGAHQTTLAGLTTQTTYHYRIHFTDGCHAIVTPDDTFTTTALLKPNLQVSGAAVPPSFAPLETIIASWAVLNAGPGDADQNWTDSVYLAKSNVLDVTATKLGDFPSVAVLPEFGTYTQHQHIAIPRVPAGSYFLIIQANSTNTLPETDSTDNTLAVPVTITTLQNLVVSPGGPFVKLHVGQTVTGTLSLTDLSLDAETGITATVTGLPANVTLTVTPPASLQSLQSGTVQYAVTATSAATLTAAPIIHLKSDAGDKADATLNLTVIPPTPLLIVAPMTLQTSMVRGGQRLVDFTVTNNGDAAALGLKPSLPSAPWLSLTTANASGDLAPGASATFELALTPAADLPLGSYTGSLGLNAANAGVTVPFAFNCISDSKGSLKIVALDEFSFFADTHPNLAGAHVILSDVTTGTIVVDDITGPDGTLTKTGVTEGNYNVDVTAPGHSNYHGTLHLLAGETNEIDPFLSRQLVTYTWTVVPVPFTDQYTITLEAVFETHVPAPVVTAAPENLDLTKVAFDAGGKAVVNYTLTNHGLIAANNTSFNINSNAQYTITPALTSLGTIPAMSSVIVPVTIQRLGPVGNAAKIASGAAKSTSAPGSTCGDAIAGIVIWHYLCVGDTTGSAKVVLFGAGTLAIGGCLILEIGEFFNSGGGGDGGGGGGGGGGSIGVIYDVGSVGGGNGGGNCMPSPPAN